MGTAVFPVLPGLTWPVEWSPSFATIVRPAVSGLETRVALRPNSLRKGKLTWDVLRSGTFNGTAYAEFQTLYGFFCARQGRYDSFLIDDSFTPDDQVVGQALGDGDGATTAFQLYRTMGGVAEPILAPNLGGAVNVYLNGVAQNGSSYAIGAWASATPGILTFNAAPGAGAAITADFNYYWPVRFDADEMTFSEFVEYLFEVKGIPIVQVMN